MKLKLYNEHNYEIISLILDETATIRDISDFIAVFNKVAKTKAVAWKFDQLKGEIK